MRHPLWDFDGDYLSAIDEWKTLHTYSVETRATPGAPDRRVLVLTPTARVPWPYYRDTQYKLLARRKVSRSGYSWVFNQGEGPRTVSVALEGSRTAVTIPEDIFDSLRAQAELKEIKLSNVQLRLRRSGLSDEEVTAMAPLLVNALCSAPATDQITKTGLIRSKPSPSYVPIGTGEPDEAKPVGFTYAPPLVDIPGMAPANCYDSEVAAVKGRVTSVANTVVPPLPRYANWANDFVSSLKRQLVPLPIGEVIERISAPSKKARAIRCLPDVDGGQGPHSFQAFVKKEFYNSAKDPRLISNMPGTHNLHLSTFTLPMSDELKQHPWYGPGKTPAEVEERLAHLAGQPLIATDYSRFDGRVSEWLERNVVHALLVQSFTDPTLATRLDWEMTAGGRTMGGVKVPAGPHRKSGSAITSVGNTLINAFVAYSSFRDVGLPHDVSLDSLGIYLGDDGVMPRCVSLEKVARELGLVLTSDTVPPGGPIPFVGRYFLVGEEVVSIQDPQRTIPKLTIGLREGIDGFLDKAKGYLTTDPLTPIIGQYCSLVVQLYGHTDHEVKDPDILHKLSMPWNQEGVDLLPLFLDVCGFEMGEVAALMAALRVVESPEGLLHLPTLTMPEPKHKIEHLDPSGDIIPATEETAQVIEEDNGSGATIRSEGGSQGPVGHGSPRNSLRSGRLDESGRRSSSGLRAGVQPRFGKSIQAAGRGGKRPRGGRGKRTKPPTEGPQRAVPK
eukprot:GHVU01162364.1.p1 GENE.GHVU01162364.1~~GHVU01162364.1.p1  ORF type:complete len:848 (-),score=47.26 GHVU01162364.1:460-2643(-)